MRSRTGLLVPAVAALAVLSGCTATASPGTGTSPSAAPASAASSAQPPRTPTSSAPPTAQAVPTPSVTPYVDPDGPKPDDSLADSDPTSRGCSNSGAQIPAGAATARIPDVDGDGKADTEYLNTTAPFGYGIRTSAGGTYAVDVPLPDEGVHSAWLAETDSGLGRAVVVDDGRTAVLFSFDGQRCRLYPIRTTGGQPFTLPLKQSAARSTGVACTNQNGGTLIAAEETRRRSDGTYDVFQALVQTAQASNPSAPADSAGLDDFAPPARYTHLAADDPRVVQASGSYCWAAPQRVQITFG